MIHLFIPQEVYQNVPRIRNVLKRIVFDVVLELPVGQHVEMQNFIFLLKALQVLLSSLRFPMRSTFLVNLAIPSIHGHFI